MIRGKDGKRCWRWTEREETLLFFTKEDALKMRGVGTKTSPIGRRRYNFPLAKDQSGGLTVMEESGLIGQERGPWRQFELGLWIFCGDIFYVSGTSVGSRGGSSDTHF